MASLIPDEGEHLATGWEPDLDPADSIVRQAVAVHASWAAHTASAIGRPYADSPDWAASYCRDVGFLSNLAILKRPLLDLPATIDEIAAWYPAGVPFLLISPWPAPPAGDDRLVLVGHPPLMLRPPGPLAAPLGGDLAVRPVATPAELEEAERILVDGYPIPELQPFRPGAVYDEPLLDDRTAVVVAYDGDTPLATAAAHTAAGVTLVENVAALPAARGRGAGAAVTWGAATAFGDDRPSVLIASDDGQPVYQRLGYLRLERWTAWLRPPS